MALALLKLFFALAILYFGAEVLVRGSTNLANRFRIPPLVIGLTIVAYGTSSPELFVSIQASLSGQSQIALGNVLGSNSFNIGIILGLTSLICPIAIHYQVIKFDAPVALGVSCLLPLLFLDGAVSGVEGLGLLVMLIIYTGLNIYWGMREPGTTGSKAESPGTPWWKDVLLIFGGLLLLYFGANWLTEAAVFLARRFGVSEAVIGLTIIAAGTSLPELITSILAALRKQPDLAVGNVIGSNIFNILGIIGVSSILAPIPINGLRALDYVIVIALTLMLLPLIRIGKNLLRIEGCLLMLAYCTYLWVIWP